MSKSNSLKATEDLLRLGGGLIKGAFSKYSSSYGNSLPLPLILNPSLVDKNMLRPWLMKLAPIVIKEGLERSLLRDGKLTNDMAQRVALKDYTTRNFKYGECSSLTNAAIAELTDNELYQKKKIMVSECAFEPKLAYCKYGLDHVALRMEVAGDERGRVIADSFLQVCCLEEEYLSHNAVLNYYKMASGLKENSVRDLLAEFSCSIVEIDSNLVTRSKIDKWHDLNNEAVRKDYNLKEVVKIFADIIQDQNSNFATESNLSRLLKFHSECSNDNQMMIERLHLSVSKSPQASPQSVAQLVFLDKKNDKVRTV